MDQTGPRQRSICRSPPPILLFGRRLHGRFGALHKRTHRDEPRAPKVLAADSRGAFCRSTNGPKRTPTTIDLPFGPPILLCGRRLQGRFGALHKRTNRDQPRAPKMVAADSRGASWRSTNGPNRTPTTIDFPFAPPILLFGRRLQGRCGAPQKRTNRDQPRAPKMLAADSRGAFSRATNGRKRTPKTIDLPFGPPQPQTPGAFWGAPETGRRESPELDEVRYISMYVCALPRTPRLATMAPVLPLNYSRTGSTPWVRAELRGLVRARNIPPRLGHFSLLSPVSRGPAPREHRSRSS